MKRVMIVDDEFLVRLGLKTTINWTAHGYIIAGEASNGREALELFDEVNPDILMTDIKMPVMDGLELISEVKKKKKLQVVILSNYDDFAYARKAVQLGASQYILKSEINEKSLLDLLKSLTVESGKEEKAQVSGRQKREEYLLGQLFGLPANGDISPNSVSVPDKSLFANPPYVVLKGFCDISGLPDSSSDMLAKTIKSIIDTTLEEPAYCSSFFKGQFYFNVICSAAKLGTDPLAKLKEQSKLLVRNTKHYFDVDLRMGISSAGGCDSFPEMFAQAETERKRCFFTKDSISIFTQDIGCDTDATVFRVSHSKVKSLVKSGEKEELIHYITEIFGELEKLQNYQYVKNVFIDLLSVAKSICGEFQIDNTPGLNPVKFNYDNLLAMPFLENVEKYVLDIYNTMFNVIQDHDDGYSYTIKNCMAYINANYASNITLEDVAQASDISSSYLSLIFKQETGINFVTYLTEYRISRAKELLTTTNLKIYEIAEKVGFGSPYYFSKVFKDIVKISCKEYKDKFSNT